MSRIGVTSPERLKLVLDVVDYLKSSGFVITPPGRGGQTVTPQTPIFVRNDSSEEIPAFGCLQISGSVDVAGQNYIRIVKPTGTTGQYLFNGIAPVAAGGYGVAHDGPVCRALTDGSTITLGDYWEPEASSWAVTPGGALIKAIGSDNIEPDVMRGLIKTDVASDEAIIDIRVSGADLQYTRDGFTWITWHTAGVVCPP
jgi:hypothetical protein